MAIEFDLHLAQRLTECDMIISSLTFRDSLTVMDRMVIESCIDNYLLCKFIAAQTGSELVARVDRTLKQCYELLSSETAISPNVKLSATGFVSVEPIKTEITVTDIPILSSKLEKAHDALEIAIAPLTTKAYLLGTLRPISIAADVSVQKILKTCVEQARSSASIGARIGSSSLSASSCVESAIDIDAIADLCYRTYMITESVATISASIADMKIYGWLGSGRSAMILDAQVKQATIRKYDIITSALDSVHELAETVIKYWQFSEALDISASMSAKLVRERLLYEIDDMSLADIDDMTLHELDYVTVG